MTLFLSHRGESDDAPENTLEAFQLAMDLDSDGIELDIRLSSDGQLICDHDGNLNRVAGVPLNVAEHTLDELRRHYPIPLLSEVFPLVRPGKMLQIEIKGSPELLPLLRETLDKASTESIDIVLSSFESESLKGAAELFPELPRVLLIDLKYHFGHLPTVEEVVALLQQCSATGISMRGNFDLKPEFVIALKNAGYRAVAWGITNDPLGLHMANIGIQAMTCNHAVALREQYRKELPA